MNNPEMKWINDLHFDKEGRDKLVSGIEKMSAAVKSTLGPNGKTVVIESKDHTRGLTVTKDGVTVAKSITLMDPVENLAVQMLRQASEETALSAGDGTTTSIVIAEALIKEIINKIDGKDDINRHTLVNEINERVDVICAQIEAMAINTTNKRIEHVATISANNDKRVGKIISGAFKKVGKSGTVIAEKGQTHTTDFKHIDGMKLQRGYTSHYFLRKGYDSWRSDGECKVLLSTVKIENFNQINGVLENVANANEKLLIIAPVGDGLLQTLVHNNNLGNLSCCVIEPPQFGYKQSELMDDLSVALGGVFIGDRSGGSLTELTYDRLGVARDVVVSQQETVITIDKNSAAITERASELKEQLKKEKNSAAKRFINERIATLSGGIGVIQVGGSTDIEQKELFDRVDDAICAVNSAVEKGVLPGGGTVLFEQGMALINGSNMPSLADVVLGKALQAPFNQILLNSGIPTGTDKYNDIVESLLVDDNGYNAKTGEYGDMMKMGVIDPVKVIVESIRNAASVATTIISTNAIITIKRG